MKAVNYQVEWQVIYRIRDQLYGQVEDQVYQRAWSQVYGLGVGAADRQVWDQVEEELL